MINNMNLEYTTVETILAKFHRDFKGTDINESDAIEWIGEALEFLKVSQIQTESVAFIEVKNYEACIPKGLHLVLQIARDLDWSGEQPVITPEVLEEVTGKSCSEPIIPIDLNWTYQIWTNCSYYRQRYTPVRLANNVFFKSLVCKEKTPYISSNKDEYTIVGVTDKKFRFSFENGFIALAYLKNALDKKTGYPLIPDNISYISAITYYIKWKMAQRFVWNGREGYDRISQDSERLWLKYARQGKNYMKMPKGIDQHQNLLEESHYLIPSHKRYFNYFGNLGIAENRNFNDPNFRSKQ